MICIATNLCSHLWITESVKNQRTTTCRGGKDLTGAFSIVVVVMTTSFRGVL